MNGWKEMIKQVEVNVWSQFRMEIIIIRRAVSEGVPRRIVSKLW